MKKVLLFSILSLIVLSITSFADLKEIQASGELKMLTQPYANIFYYEDGKPAGFDYDMMSNLAEYLGVKLVIKDWDDWDDIIPALNRKDGDVIAAGMSITATRKEIIDFSTPYFNNKIVLVTYKDNPASSIASIKGDKIAVVKGTTFETIAQSIKGTEVEYPTTVASELMGLLKAKKVKYILTDMPDAKFSIKAGEPIKIIGVVPGGGTDFYGFGIRKLDKDLLNKINEWLKKIKTDGTYDKLSEKHFK